MLERKIGPHDVTPLMLRQQNQSKMLRIFVVFFYSSRLLLRQRKDLGAAL